MRVYPREESAGFNWRQRFARAAASTALPAPHIGAVPAAVDTPQRAVDILYLPALDGLRFIAFLLVFFVHLAAPDGFLSAHGWVGVELFFTISAFLFFHLMAAEWEKRGTIDTMRFYGRRLLRLYPLMAAFPALMILIYGLPSGGLGRLAGLLLFSDNYLAWWSGFNPIPYCAQLWTLSSEFQIYLFIPLAFFASRRLGDQRFIYVLLAAAAVGTIGRFAFVWFDAPHPIIWVTPFLRPETTLLGMGLALGICRGVDWRIVASFGLGAATIFVLLPWHYMQGNARMWVYPVEAIMCGAAVWLAAFHPLVGSLLSARWIVYLGKISFGLYVFHLWAIDLAAALLHAVRIPVTYSTHFATALCLCVGLAATSYAVFERPFLRAKSRLEVVQSRPS